MPWPGLTSLLGPWYHCSHSILRGHMVAIFLCSQTLGSVPAGHVGLDKEWDRVAVRDRN